MYDYLSMKMYLLVGIKRLKVVIFIEIARITDQQKLTQSPHIYHCMSQEIFARYDR